MVGGAAIVLLLSGSAQPTNSTGLQLKKTVRVTVSFIIILLELLPYDKDVPPLLMSRPREVPRQGEI